MTQYSAYLEHNEERVQKDLVVAKSKEIKYSTNNRKKKHKKEGAVGTCNNHLQVLTINQDHHSNQKWILLKETR